MWNIERKGILKASEGVDQEDLFLSQIVAALRPARPCAVR